MRDRRRKQRRAAGSNDRARLLREDQTDVERRLWYAVRDRHIDFLPLPGSFRVAQSGNRPERSIKSGHRVA